MSGFVDPDGVALVLNCGILLVGGLLSVLSLLAWRRERDRKMLTVSVAYVLFALRGLVIIVGYLFHPLVDPETVRPASSVLVAVVLLDHFSALLVLVGLVLFFVALVRG